MPTDDFGNVADVIVSIDTVPNRMNPSQLIEQDMTYISSFIRKRAEIMYNQGNVQEAYDYILKFVEMVNPIYKSNVIERVVGQDNFKMREYVEDSIKDGIVLICPPFLETIGPKLSIKLHEEFQIPRSPVEFNLRDDDGELIRRVRTVKDVTIGSKYMYLLCKIPKTKSAGVAYINQHKLPIRQHNDSKMLSPISIVPIREGEDEIRQLQVVAEPDEITRFISLYSNSYAAVEKAVETILTAEVPSNIPRINMTTDEMIKTNIAIGINQHMLSTLGIDSTNMKIIEVPIEGVE